MSRNDALLDTGKGGWFARERKCAIKTHGDLRDVVWE